MTRDGHDRFRVYSGATLLAPPQSVEQSCGPVYSRSGGQRSKRCAPVECGMGAGASQGAGRRFAPPDVPVREPFRAWLHGSLTRERTFKTGSTGAISEEHLDDLKDLRRELLKHGYSGRQLSNRSLTETAVELLYAHALDGRRVRGKGGGAPGKERAVRRGGRAHLARREVTGQPKRPPGAR